MRSPELILSWLVLALYLLSFGGYLVVFLKRRRGRSWPGHVLLILAICVHIAAVIVRGKLAGHLPFASRFEALLFYGLVSAALALVIGLIRLDVPVALLTLPVVIVFMLGALMGGDKAPRPLPPVLNSPFFSIHVVLAFLGYGFYTVNFGLGVGALFARREPLHSVGRIGRGTTVSEFIGLARSLVPWGLVFLGAGIGLGSVWAMFSWGNWWGWDPKESAALVTWLSYLLYVHSPNWKRPARRTSSVRSDAVFLIGAYVLLVITFLGVNLLKRGLHAY
jgi:ABC-type transport system involved in cytochrome c biogenesis permease subunit